MGLIDIRNFFLKALKKGDYYKIDVVNRLSGNTDSFEIYGLSEEDAQEQAYIKSYNLYKKSSQADHPNFAKRMTRGVKIFKGVADTTEFVEAGKNSSSSIVGTKDVFRLSVKEMISPAKKENRLDASKLTDIELNQHKQNAIFAIFVWVGFLFVSVFFLALGFDEGLAKRFSLINNYLVGGGIGVFLSLLAIAAAALEAIKTHRLLASKRSKTTTQKA